LSITAPRRAIRCPSADIRLTLGGAIGFNDLDNGAVTASQATMIISSARKAATIQPKIWTRRRHGVGGAKALGGPAPNSRGAGDWGAGASGSFIGSTMLYYSPDTVKPVPHRDNRKLTTIYRGLKGKDCVNSSSCERAPLS
jgi:hypothetical protein